MPALSRPALPILALLGALPLLAACAREAATAPDPGAPPGEIPLVLFEANDALEEDWQKFDVWQNTSFDLVPAGDRIAIRARAKGASGLLARRVSVDPETCPQLEWSWTVEGLPSTADLSSRKAEDMAAAIFVAFGDPGVFSNPDPVPTLRYVWSTSNEPKGTVVASPYFPATLRSVVVRSGPADVGTVVTERRDLLADFEAAFGGEPEDRIEVLALFIDSDHGEEPLEAHFLGARALCIEEPEAPSIFD
ncbi:MAG: DUF3047 domain-containing protein [Pseudomonadota bacterium]